jgi:LuxR family maltose regulon positive regulatory protein
MPVTKREAGTRDGYASRIPLVEAKTARPQLTRSPVRRQRLFDMLDAAMGTPVTLVCAGAGWGKTLLVSAWAHARDRPVAWLSLDRHDNDPQLFWAYVIAALRVAGAVPADNPLANVGSVPADQRERVRQLADGLGRLPHPTVLVVDDFHEITDEQVLGEMDDLLRYPPNGTRLLLISRAQPALSMHRLRAAGQVTEIRATDLAFTEAEAAALLAGHGHEPTPDDVTALLERTEGWAVGLNLGAGYLAGRDDSRTLADFTGDTRGVIEYLIGEVLAGRSRRHRRFLLQTSICEQLCADLANAITAQQDGQRTLERLESDNDFVVRLGETPIWFRYHHLLREALGHNLLRETPALVFELHRRAARWYASNNSIMEALNHAIAARDWAYVGRLVTGKAAPLILSVHRHSLARVLQEVPAEKLTSTPELIVCAAVLLFHSGDYDAIPARLNHARELLRRHPDHTRQPVEIMLLTLQLAADRVVGDMTAVHAGCTELLALLPAQAEADGAAVTQLRAIALNNRGVAQLWTGRVEAAARDLWAAATAARTAGLDLTEINAVGHLALLQVLHGSVHEAAGLAAGARDLIERGGWRNTIQSVAAHLAQALVELERHDLDAAEEAVRAATQAHDSDPEAAQRIVLHGVRARLALAGGDDATARYHLTAARRDRNARIRVPALDQWLSLADAEADLAAGRPERVAEHLIGRSEDLPQRVIRARAARAVRDLPLAQKLLTVDRPAVLPHTAAAVEAGIVHALIADSRAQAGRAAELLSSAVVLAEREGIRRPFHTHAGGRLDELLHRLQLVNPRTTSFIDELRGDIRAGHDAGSVDGLSEREKEVLRFLPTNLTAGQIAAELGISVNTVRAHQRAIYRKCGAARRSDAVVWARDHGLL